MTADLVRGLLADQAPHLAHLDLAPFASGWDNAVFRLGEACAVRLPVRAAAAPLVVHEQQWLLLVAAHLDVPVPRPVVDGAAGRGYPWRWSVVPWLAGATLDTVPVAAGTGIAAELGAALAQLHRPAPADAPPNAFRGIPLARREALDFGDSCAGDPASDRATAWLSFDDEGGHRFREAYAGSGPLDDALWARRRGWAAALAVAFLAGRDPDGALHDVARHAVRQLA